MAQTPAVIPGDELVSVVIPTKGRPELLLRAIESVLQQTYKLIEVIVVLDGLDEATTAALHYFREARLRVITLAEATGGSEARNIGVRAAAGTWVAFLDDDDEWLPEKIERQMTCAVRSKHRYPIVSSRFFARVSGADAVMPRRVYRGENIAEYLFLRKSLRYGDGLLHTSTLLMPRELLLQVPFQKGLERHQDWDLMLRLARYPGVGVKMLPDALAVIHMEEHRPTVSRASDWRFSLIWAQDRRTWMSRLAYSFFIATECMPRAAKSSATWRERLLLLKECILTGLPCWRSLPLALAFALRRPGPRNTP